MPVAAHVRADDRERRVAKRLENEVRGLLNGLCAKDHQSQQQKHDKDYKEDIEQDTRDVCACCRNVRKAEQRRHQRDDQENKGPFSRDI